MKKYIRQGELRAEKYKYPDGIGCTIWNSPGCCYDFPEEWIDDFIKILQRLKDLPAQKYIEIATEEVKEKKSKSFKTIDKLIKDLRLD